jgi:hypothetical protein
MYTSEALSHDVLANEQRVDEVCLSPNYQIVSHFYPTQKIMFDQLRFEPQS